MGDHRASIKIEFSMHGHTDKTDMWVNYYPNYYPDDGCRTHKVDRRVMEWLTSAYETAMEKYLDAQYDAEEMARAKRENQERDELKRLKEKYEGQP